MEHESLRAILTLAFGLGVIHALDADHVAAVTTLASRRPRLRSSLGFAARWAAGHSATLFAVVLAWLVLGLHLPDWAAVAAEYSVAALLIAMGAALLWTLRTRRLRLGFHVHPGQPAHAHWHSDAASNDHDPARERTHAQTHAHDRTQRLSEGPGPQHDHSAVLIGALHGFAGSAPVFALIPAIAGGEPAWALAHLSLFSIGMLLAMLACGGLLGAVTERLTARRFGRGLVALRAAVGLCAIGAGIRLAAGLWLAV